MPKGGLGGVEVVERAERLGMPAEQQVSVVSGGDEAGELVGDGGCVHVVRGLAPDGGGCSESGGCCDGDADIDSV